MAYIRPEHVHTCCGCGQATPCNDPDCRLSEREEMCQDCKDTEADSISSDFDLLPEDMEDYRILPLL